MIALKRKMNLCFQIFAGDNIDHVIVLGSGGLAEEGEVGGGGATSAEDWVQNAFSL